MTYWYISRVNHCSQILPHTTIELVHKILKLLKGVRRQNWNLDLWIKLKSADLMLGNSNTTAVTGCSNNTLNAVKPNQPLINLKLFYFLCVIVVVNITFYAEQTIHLIVKVAESFSSMFIINCSVSPQNNQMGSKQRFVGLQDVLEDVKLLRWRRLQDVLETNKCLTCLKDVLDDVKLSRWQCLQDISWRHLEDIMETKKIPTVSNKS